jgi:hypothetical protein
MISSQEERIRARAYAIWMEEGRPHGKHEEHWHRAAREIEQEAGGRGSGRKATASKAGATKAGVTKAAGGNASAAASSRATPKAEAIAKKSGAAKPRRNSRAPAS